MFFFTHVDDVCNICCSTVCIEFYFKIELTSYYDHFFKQLNALFQYGNVKIIQSWTRSQFLKFVNENSSTLSGYGCTQFRETLRIKFAHSHHVRTNGPYSVSEPYGQLAGLSSGQLTQRHKWVNLIFLENSSITPRIFGQVVTELCCL